MALLEARTDHVPSRTPTGPQQLKDMGRPGALALGLPRHFGRDACWHKIRLRTDRHDWGQRHGKCLAVMKCALPIPGEC